MKVRITYRTECMIEAESLAEAKSIWESVTAVPRDTKDAKFEFIETVSVEDGDTYLDIEHEFNNLDELEEELDEVEKEDDGMDVVYC